MPAYLIANVVVKDVGKFKNYLKATPPVIEKYGGKFLVRGGEIQICEGDWNPERLVMVEFESMERARAFYDSPEYEAIKDLRCSSAYTEFIFVEGLPPETID